MKKTLASAVGILSTLAVAAPAFAGTTIRTCPSGTTGFAGLCNLRPETALPFIITAILVIAVVIALFFLIWGGIKWITSGGDKGGVESARNTIIAAIVGLIVVFLAWFIINIVLRIFTGQDISQNLNIPQIPTSAPLPTTRP